MNKLLSHAVPQLLKNTFFTRCSRKDPTLCAPNKYISKVKKESERDRTTMRISEQLKHLNGSVLVSGNLSSRQKLCLGHGIALALVATNEFAAERTRTRVTRSLSLKSSSNHRHFHHPCVVSASCGVSLPETRISLCVALANF